MCFRRLFSHHQRRSAPVAKEQTAPIVYHDADGRRHRADAPYLLPKDEKEIQRLDYQHFLFRQILRGNTYAPVDALLKAGGNVLDVGCGTGRWGCEIATQYKKTSVMGFDLEEVPRTDSVPLNYQFQRGNLLNGLPFVGQQFQYVHQRALVAGIPFDKWPFVISELKRVTCVGGWVELIEMGATFHNAGPATKQFLQWWAAISATQGIETSKVAQLATFLHELAFSHVQAETKHIAVGSWGGRLGSLLAQDILAGWPTMRPYAHTLLDVPPAHFDAMIQRLTPEWNSFHTTYEVYCACGKA